MTVKYVPNFPVIEAAGEFYGHLAMAQLVPEIEAEAKSLAPVETGAYRDSITSTISGTKGVVSANIRYAVYLEFGTSDTPVFATLRQASESVKI